MTKPYQDFCGVYLQEQGNKYVFFIKGDQLHLSANGDQIVLSPHESDKDTFVFDPTKVKVKFNRTSQGFCHFVDFYFADRHTIAVRKFDGRSSLERILSFDKRDFILLFIGFCISLAFFATVFKVRY
ncbi:MAG: hypothetical protein COW00_07210 [Bdellovibrio sp. CG12_big_fil_rev_8_21_14_0_65_39_13]|nr:MAG: hypothetical protein COW78_17010 [Bdellovibrio sp. CG22_combo_CG10-13_8_21_14_all_39_27]PIQ60275.1 MAG: hypothetical protein COW00_07210 [Bdellovibrio sp. CG12_big_fil_rev_8_21_14_0_65_39_13]PIR34711.1 MAG: hypothetical protein COV37_12315 [Bdellovibrio sp. CG11_big_fil_rev_8_21_14_0_20_39_38]PJB53317.1 MAG: hypothetical protein CO099_07825 [Bdellovibrio sp. CG_4_9_14_3_um_filter_39_7]